MQVVDIKRSFQQKQNGTHQKDFFVVDEEGHFNGIVGYDNGGYVVFVKIPCKHTIDQSNTPIVGKYVGGLKELLKNKDKGQGDKKIGKITNKDLPPSFNRGLKEACQKFPHLNEFSTGLFSAIATGLNAYLCQHVDEESFWSTTFIHCDDKKMLEKNQKYKLNVPVVSYFVFGKLGHAVELSVPSEENS